jgi:hypothetical protein
MLYKCMQCGERHPNLTTTAVITSRHQNGTSEKKKLCILTGIWQSQSMPSDVNNDRGFEILCRRFQNRIQYLIRKCVELGLA